MSNTDGQMMKFGDAARIGHWLVDEDLLNTIIPWTELKFRNEWLQQAVSFKYKQSKIPLENCSTLPSPFRQYRDGNELLSYHRKSWRGYKVVIHDAASRLSLFGSFQSMSLMLWAHIHLIRKEYIGECPLLSFWARSRMRPSQHWYRQWSQIPIMKRLSKLGTSST